jgi:hypothetical protein
VGLIVPPPIQQFDKVRIVALRDNQAPSLVGSRSPQVGDVATVVEVYSHPPGYELECATPQGTTMWLESFAEDEVSLELVGKLQG